ncbi:MAG: sugar ABC transporter permease [Bacillus thermozeamaize]|uniref:Sugar ABC transporter permease n=1 Tax=Bacillus thermozeamaize TaxID=230954 RepID=A0A1Y3PH71_9BACI|nr:MAG: sugar ABC transporter permease [Bacillus thermozeamaize]
MRNKLKWTMFYLGVFVIAAVFVVPLLWLVSTSFKNYIDAFALPPKLIFTPTLENYTDVLRRSDFMRALMNSVVISTSSTLLAVALGALSAYALVFLELRRKTAISTFFLSARIIPPVLMVLPIYFLAVKLGMTDSYTVLILFYTMINLPFVIMMLRTFFLDIPNEIREAAIIDGCSEMRVFLQTVLPLARGGIAATFVLSMLLTWNEFFIALILSGKSTQTLPVLITSFMTFQGTEWGSLSAAGTMIMLPMLIFGLLVQKNLVRGMTMGAVK